MSEGKTVIDEMEKNYNKATKIHDTLRGTDDWYKYCSIVITKMEKEGVDRGTLLDFLVAHIVEELRFDDILIILNYLDIRSESDFEKKIKEYLDSNIINNNDVEGMFLQNTGKLQLIVKKKEIWQLAKPEDYQDFIPEMTKIYKQFLPADTKLNKIVGFIVNFKKDYMIFKVKLMTRKRHKGARCDQSGKNEAVNLLNQILGREDKEDKYDSKDKKINQKQICVTQEFTLRLFDKKKKDGKRWFLTPTQAVLTNIENINFK